MSRFEDFKLNKQLLDAVKEAGYESPTPIQEKAIPLVLEGHDVMGIAQTGTGKTAAFVLPMLMKLKFSQGTSPRALIVAPTRELAFQIDQNIALLAKNTDLKHTAVFGGTGMKKQIEIIEKGIDIIIATPGRLMDLYFAEVLLFKDLNTFILDEADKLMDMGFMPQIRKILEIIPHKKRQNLLFSATIPEKVQKLSEEFLDFPTIVEITPSATTAETVRQRLLALPNLQTKINCLRILLEENEAMQKVLVFVRTKKIAENVRKYLARKFSEESVRAIHANKSQNTRLNAMKAFQKGDIRVLVATDVAARGIDISQVSHVINFDVPLIYEDYVHRIGRTGRAFNKGEAITFMNLAEEYHIKKIEEIIQMKIPVENPPETLEFIETPFEEKQAIDREIDRQRRKEDPNFKGAFHEKKKKKK